MPRNLARRWKQNLPSSIDTSITNVLSNQRGVYVGFNDHVYRLNHSSGDIQSEYDMKTGLPTEIRLAASQDASVFLIGGYGYVERLDPDSLHKTWSTSLPWCGFQVVSLIIDGKRVFAGSNGHVYRLDVDSGEVQASNSLPGTGDHETRVALTFSLSTLLVGIDGIALGLNSDDLTLRWRNSLHGSLWDITSVIGGDKVGYAGIRGHVYRIDEATGDTLHQNDLPGTGTEEVRFALDNTLGKYLLYVATYGYGIGLNLDNLETVYSTSLPGSGYSNTDVVAGYNGFAYFANNGYVFLLDPKGGVSYGGQETGLPRSETRLAVFLDGDSDQVVAGVDGECIQYIAISHQP